MEGTRNEKVIIVLSAYVIGFTTAFIAFGIQNAVEPHEESQNFNSSHIHELTITPEVQTISGTAKNDIGFFVVTNGYERLLSAKKSSLGASAISSTATSGFHASIIADAVSKDAQFVYFCEQQTEEAKNCTPYVYSLADDSLHPVKVNGEKYQPEVADQTASWSDDGKLTINAMISNTAEKPWEFTVANNAAVEAEAPSNTIQILPSEMPAETQTESALPQDDQVQVQ